MIHSFGRSDQLDKEDLKRLINSMNRFLDPEDIVQSEHGDDDLEITSCKVADSAYSPQKPLKQDRH